METLDKFIENIFNWFISGCHSGSHTKNRNLEKRNKQLTNLQAVAL